MTVPGALALSALFLMTAPTLGAQLISIKTVPIAQGDQFDIFPSQHRGMGGVSLALAVTLLDPFRNPARAGLRKGSNSVSARARDTPPMPRCCDGKMSNWSPCAMGTVLIEISWAPSVGAVMRNRADRASAPGTVIGHLARDKEEGV